jgi:hypothetical protein
LLLSIDLGLDTTDTGLSFHPQLLAADRARRAAAGILTGSVDPSPWATPSSSVPGTPRHQRSRSIAPPLTSPSHLNIANNNVSSAVYINPSLPTTTGYTEIKTPMTPKRHLSFSIGVDGSGPSTDPLIMNTPQTPGSSVGRTIGRHLRSDSFHFPHLPLAMTEEHFNSPVPLPAPGAATKEPEGIILYFRATVAMMVCILPRHTRLA